MSGKNGKGCSPREEQPFFNAEWRKSARGFGGQGADLVQTLGGALVQHRGCIRARLGRDRDDLAAVTDTLLDHLLGVFGVLGDPVLGRGRLGQVAQQRRKSLERLASQLDLAARERLHAFDGQLVGLGQRLDVAALRCPYRLDIERPEAVIGEHLGHVEIEKVGTSICHDGVPFSGSATLCTAQSAISGMLSWASRAGPLCNITGKSRMWVSLPRATATLSRTSARFRAAGGRAPPWSARDPATRR